MNDSEVIDFRELERELANAVAADEKYQRENAAKFRAIHQKVASYEEFRDIVAASNLKPLERKDKIGGDRKQPWNPTATTSSSSKEPASAALQESQLSEPRNAFEFTRVWRRIDMERRYDFLLQIGAEKLSHIFHAEVCSGLLGEFLLVLEEHLQHRQLAEVMEILQCLAKTPRFHLNLVFLGKDERARCQELFVKLQTLVNDEKEADGQWKSTIMQLTIMYKIDVSN
ncbi:dynein axonemal assembly factor 19 isoform X2 [Rhinoderma darwinii]